MSLEILARVGKTDYGGPIFKVRCTACGAVYRRTGCKADVKKSRGCASCGQKKRDFSRDSQGRMVPA